jgi:hypothetical protein
MDQAGIATAHFAQAEPQELQHAKGGRKHRRVVTKTLRQPAYAMVLTDGTDTLHGFCVSQILGLFKADYGECIVR